ncbi:uncharacterized protein LOC111265862 [Varroa jacobsoni]|uniref:uncharacterized protein LOC111265862 n=1 Tax=Varroa jacobsoni TaxID=62625 RepID=UPI000BF7D2F5|nr:uncharacterized protein LOC111265862 [Varroa jacobsoni]XP_022698579.1 uncharacterized protein LOC111265862 [Varroa jacobsoni]
MMLMMDLYEESCLQLHEMIESDIMASSELDCGGNAELGSPHLPPLEGMGALDSLDPSWLSDSQGPLNSNDLDSLDVGLMVNPQTGLPSLCSGGTSSINLSSSGVSSSGATASPLTTSTTTTASAATTKKNGGAFTLLGSGGTSSSGTSSNVTNSTSAGSTTGSATVTNGILNHSTGTATSKGLTTTVASSGGMQHQSAQNHHNNSHPHHHHQQPTTPIGVGNSTSAATPVGAVVAGGVGGSGGVVVSSTPQPLTASNVQALLGQQQQANNVSQISLSQPAAKKGRLTVTADEAAGLINGTTANGGLGSVVLTANVLGGTTALGAGAGGGPGAPGAGSHKVFPKPAYSYSCLIAMALKNSKTGSLPVNEIYNFMIENFPYFKTAPNGWKNSVRHNLSLNKCFEKIEKPTTGPNGTQRKGCLWAMNPSKVGKMDEEVQKWSKKDPAAIRRSMAKPERLELLEKGFLKELYGSSGEAGCTDSLDDLEDLEDEMEDAGGHSSADEDIDTLLPDTPPTSQDEEAGSVKVKLIDSSALEKFESSPWDTWETLQPQDENKPTPNKIQTVQTSTQLIQAAVSSGVSVATSGSGQTVTLSTSGSPIVHPQQQHSTSIATGNSSTSTTTTTLTTKKLVLTAGGVARRAVVNAEGGTLCATGTPNTYIFTPSSHSTTATTLHHSTNAHKNTSPRVSLKRSNNKIIEI